MPPIIPPPTQRATPLDLNFCFPLPEQLESPRVKLTPFIVRFMLSDA